MAALDSGKVDAIATPNLSLTYDYMPVISIGFSDYYFGVSKSRPDLLKELNVALYDIQNSELDYNNLLVSRYQKKMSNSLMLDDEEKQWLDEHGNTIKLGYLNDNLPYSIQSEEGEMLGVMKTLKDTLEQELKVTVQTQCYETCRELTSALEQGKVDAIGPVYSDFYLAEGKNYVLTNSFITTTPVMIFKNPDPSTNSDVIAVSNESLLPEDVVSLLYPDAELYVCDGIEECLKAVVSGKANSTLVTSVCLNVLRQYDEMHELQFADTSVQSEICLATTKEHRVSAGILNKGILLASDTFNGVALAENSYVEKEVSFGDYVRSHMMAVFAGAGIIILFLVLMAYKLFVNGRKLSVALEEAKREKEHAYELYLNNNELKIKASQDAMTNIGNRYHFFKKIDELLEQKEKFALCYCDLDNLKIINDRYGHSEGDCYIRGFVSIIKSELKSEDVFARMGGDEFCIIFKNCDYETTAEKMKQLQSTFRNEHEKCYLKNFSFGIIEISENYDEIDVMDILKQVDERMYDQKKEHKKEQSGLLTGIPERQES